MRRRAWCGPAAVLGSLVSTAAAGCGPTPAAPARCPEPPPAPVASEDPTPVVQADPSPPTLGAPSPYERPASSMHRVDVGGVFDLGPAHGGMAVVLFDPASGRVVPILIGDREALTISMRLAGQAFPRPLTHDLLDAVLQALDGQIERVEIDAIEEGTFLAHLYVRDASGSLHRIDARPSDCIVLAVGAHADIYMAQQVLDRAGEPADLGIDPEALPSSERPTA